MVLVEGSVPWPSKFPFGMVHSPHFGRRNRVDSTTTTAFNMKSALQGRLYATVRRLLGFHENASGHTKQEV